MSDYDGPAVLIAADGTNIPVIARLTVQADPVVSAIDSDFVEVVGMVRSWGGTIEAEALAGRSLTPPVRLRFPNGRQSNVYAAQPSDAPRRLVVQWSDDPPWLDDRRDTRVANPPTTPGESQPHHSASGIPRPRPFRSTPCDCPRCR